MAGKRLLVGLFGTLAVAALAAANGCGSGKGAAGGGAPAVATRMSLLTKFDVNVKTGKVSITKLDSKGKAVLTGGAISFTSSDLLSVGGDSGKRLVRLSIQNLSNEITPSTMRLIVGNLANSTTADLKPSTITSTLAGSGTAGTNDGYGASAQFNNPVSVAVGAGPLSNSLIVTDDNNHRIRQVQLDGTVSTVAGSSQGFNDLTGTAAQFNTPMQAAVDSAGNVFIADMNNFRVRRMTPLGEVTTIAGNGTQGTGDGASGIDASFFTIRGLAVSSDGARIYVADLTKHYIRKIVWNGTGQRNLAASYLVSTVAGTNGTFGFQDNTGTSATFNNPMRLALTTDLSGVELLHVVDRGNHAIRRIYDPSNAAVVTTVAGNGSSATVDGPGSKAQFASPYGIAALTLSSGGQAIYVSEDSQKIRQILLTSGNEPQQKGNYNVTTITGTGTTGTTDGDGNTATFSTPDGMAAVVGSDQSVTLFVVDAVGNKVRKINVPSGVIHSGGPTSGVTEAVRLVNWDSEVPHTGGATGIAAAWVKAISPASNGVGYAADIQFFVPSGISGFSFTAYLEADTNLVNLPGVGSSYVTTLAGDNNVGDANGPGKLAEFNQPNSVAPVPSSLQGLFAIPVRALIVDKVNNRIRAIDTSGNVSTFASGFTSPSAITLGPDGSAYVTEPTNSIIRRVTPTGSVSTIAGLAGTPGTTDGTNGTSARFTSPTGITVDVGGAIFVSEVKAGTTGDVRRIVYTSGDASLSGSYTVSTPLTTGLTNPFNLDIDTDGRIYCVNGTTVQVLTRSGSNLTTASYATGLTAAQGVTIDTAHNLYVTDNNQIKRISPGGSPVTTLGGSTSGYVDGSTVDPVAPAKFNGPTGIAVEASGTLLVADFGSNTIRAIQRIISDAQVPQQ